MENYYEVILAQDKNLETIKSKAFQEFSCEGLEEFCLDEARVDEILGDRAYSGGDIPVELLDEVEEKSKSTMVKFFFSQGEDAQERAKKFQEFLKSNYKNLLPILNVHKTQDWNEEWKKHFSPIEISENFAVIPEWLKDDGSFKRKHSLYIYPGMGFGTGTHETTFLCLKLFLELQTRGLSIANVLDYGCGSGILGIGAKVFYPGVRAGFVDIDNEALKNTQHNLELNNCLDKTRLFEVTQREDLDSSYDVVFANILQNVLHIERDYLINKTHQKGFLILSGLLKDQMKETGDFYERTQRIEVIREVTKGDWGALLLKRS